MSSCQIAREEGERLDLKRNEWKLRDFLHIWRAGFPEQGIISIDVTYRCNLSCTHCYFRRQGYRSELTLDQWLSWLEDRRSQGYPFLICGWLGGEPFLRRDVLEKGLAYFKSNVIFTNGTFDLSPPRESRWDPRKSWKFYNAITYT